MFVTKLKTTFAVVLALAMIGGAGLFTYYLRAQDAPKKQEDARPPAAKEIKRDKIAISTMESLLEERRDMAEQEVKVRYKQYREGAVGPSLDELLASSKRLLKAETQVVKRWEDRLAAYERHLKLTKELAKVVKAQYNLGRIGLAEYSRWEYERSDAEIELEFQKRRIKQQKEILPPEPIPEK